jgi:hypothetical protein
MIRKRLSSMVSRFFNSWMVGVVLAAWLLSNAGDNISHAKTKAKSRPPDLKILSVDTTPLPFVPNGTPLTLIIKIELPKVIPEEALLDVSTLITSTSRSSFRLLSSRQMLRTTGDISEPASETERRLEVVQIWDGTDHNDRIVVEGMYDYQVQAKLMVLNKSGAPLTRINAWKKRGILEVRAQPTVRSD